MPVQFRDYYETLGVSKTATSDDIRKAFRKLARQHHPDVAKDKKSAEEKFKQINEAYEISATRTSARNTTASARAGNSTSRAAAVFRARVVGRDAAAVRAPDVADRGRRGGI